MSAIGYRLSAVGCPLDGIPERGRRQTVRHQTYFIPDSKRVQALSAPGFYGLSAFQCGEAATVISSGAACWYGGRWKMLP